MADKPKAPEGLAPAKPPPWNDPAVRSLVFQALALALLGYFFYAVFDNTLSNMERRGITTGFRFLNEQAGFGILMSLIDYSETDTYGRTFFVGLLNTLLVSFLGIIFATILGFILGVARLSRNWLISKLAAVYIETFRNIPLLLQIFFWYIAVLQTLPGAKQSMKIGEAFFSTTGRFIFPRRLRKTVSGWSPRLSSPPSPGWFI